MLSSNLESQGLKCRPQDVRSLGVLGDPYHHPPGVGPPVGGEKAVEGRDKGQAAGSLDRGGQLVSLAHGFQQTHRLQPIQGGPGHSY